MIPDVKPELRELISNIGNKSMYYGNRMPASVLALFTIEETDTTCGILVPYWIGVFQKGRGPRKNTKNHGLVNVIYNWMHKRNMFRSVTAKGKLNEARFMTFYINKHGNAHFRSKRFIDIYDTEREKTIKKINTNYGLAISKITMDVI